MMFAPAAVSVSIDPTGPQNRQIAAVYIIDCAILPESFCCYSSPSPFYPLTDTSDCSSVFCNSLDRRAVFLTPTRQMATEQ